MPLESRKLTAIFRATEARARVQIDPQIPLQKSAAFLECENHFQQLWSTLKQPTLTIYGSTSLLYDNSIRTQY